MKEYRLEFPNEIDKTCALKPFLDSLDFVRGNEEFKLVDSQRFLRCGYGTLCKVRDALVALCMIEMLEKPFLRYKKLIQE